MVKQSKRNVILRFQIFFKEWLFSYFWIAPLVSFSFIPWAFSTNGNFESIAAIIGGTLGFCYFIQQQKLAEAAFFRQTFTDFNGRYDEYNDSLMKIVESNTIGDRRSKLIDYFNLCAEEYLLYKRGYIPTEVWDSWVSGMFQYWSVPEVQKLWIKELATGSYYDFNPAEHFSSRQLNLRVNENSDRLAA